MPEVTCLRIKLLYVCCVQNGVCSLSYSRCASVCKWYACNSQEWFHLGVDDVYMAKVADEDVSLKSAFDSWNSVSIVGAKNETSKCGVENNGVGSLRVQVWLFDCQITALINIVHC